MGPGLASSLSIELQLDQDTRINMTAKQSGVTSSTSPDKLVSSLVSEACVRSLADDATVNLELVSDAAQPGFSQGMPTAALSAHRGELDAYALRHAHHDSALHQQLTPVAALERALFDVFEQERYEAIGCNEFAGVQINLDARPGMPPERFASESATVVGQSKAESSIERLLQAARVLSRNAFRRHTIDQSSDRYNAEYASLWSIFGSQARDLGTALGDQQSFALKVRALLEQWQRVNTRDYGADQHLQGTVDEGEALADQSPENASADEDDIDNEPDYAEFSAEDNEAAKEGEQSTSEAEGESLDGEALADQQLDEAPGSGRDPLVQIDGSTAAYKMYTTEFDEICHASQFADREALATWRLQLDEHIDVHSRLVRRLAARLQRVLLARQRRHWQFDMEEGHLDSARLSRIVSDPLVPLSFKSESEAPMRNTAITLLIDNSRSMLGRPIMIAAAATDILARTLEQCGVSVEILGFTTVHLHGGRSTELWESRGKPENPGRLNDLRHIVYKSADTSYRSARRQLGLMLDKDILKQNIDGESLLWAHQRLLKRPEERRILMMISDGAPVDTSTLGANSGDYLSSHLRTVIGDIERAGRVELLAIGIGHDVSRYYSQALSVFDARQLGPAMLNRLESLLRKAA